MRARKLSILPAALAVVCASFALAGVGIASANARAKARTGVSIDSWPGGVFGYVESPKAKRCAARRGVTVFKQRGAEQDPRRDRRIGKAKAERNHGYQWSLKTRRGGDLYVKARRTNGCRVAFSKIVDSDAGDDVPNCPSKEDVCRFPNMHVDLVEIHPCPSFTAEQGNCGGSSEGGASPWSPEDVVDFRWNQNPGSSGRGVTYDSFYSPDEEHSKIKAALTGYVPGPGSADFSIKDAYALGWDQHWGTPDVPGVGAGQQGGPLYLDFENGSWGADVYIRGYLYRK